MKSKKQGLSEMIGYVLLIVIAISLSVMVYAWLKGYVWKPQETCADGISISIEDYSCDSISYVINVSLRNTGTFNIWGFIIRGGNSTKAIYPLKAAENTIEADTGKIIFADAAETMKPDETRNFFFKYGVLKNISVLEIEPIQVRENKILLCEGAIINQEIKNC